jgi:hypothetical protein
MPALRREVDLYAPATEARDEVVLMEDGIQVKQQKAQRERHRGAATKQQPSGEASSSKQKCPTKKKRVSTDVAMLEKRDGSYEHLCAGIDEQGEALYDCSRGPPERRRGALRRRGDPTGGGGYHRRGSKNIRSHLERVFDGAPIPVILDW